MTKELAKTNSSAIAVLASKESAATLQSMFDAGVVLYQLPKIKVPPGGITAFTVEGGLTGEENLKEIECVISATRPSMRSWYRQNDGPLGTAPDCSSIDGRTGIGNNIETGSPDGEGVHQCIACPWSKPGSDRKGGKRSDCKEFSEVYCFVGSNRMPNLLKIPISSKKAFTTYMMTLVNAGHRIDSVVTKLMLKKTQNKAGQTYSEIAFAFVRPLDQAELAAAATVSQVISSAIASAIVAAAGRHVLVDGNDDGEID
jgi:hypothetical protein